jgi:predicted nucleic acid-binding protein
MCWQSMRVFRGRARFMHRQPDPLSEDAKIAATAQCHGLTIATRNASDFARLGVPTVNPFKASAP